jgi:hypothetical protein
MFIRQPHKTDDTLRHVQNESYTAHQSGASPKPGAPSLSAISRWVGQAIGSKPRSTDIFRNLCAESISPLSLAIDPLIRLAVAAAPVEQAAAAVAVVVVAAAAVVVAVAALPETVVVAVVAAVVVAVAVAAVVAVVVAVHRTL